jgi:carboxymethylenebutenolidase
MRETRRQTASDFDPEVMRLFDQYVHGVIDRRGFLTGAARYAAGSAAAVVIARRAEARSSRPRSR